MNRKYVSAANFSTSAAATTTTTTTTSSTRIATVKTLSNVRSGPGTGYGILGQVTTGTQLTVTGHTSSNWYIVNYNGQTLSLIHI